MKKAALLIILVAFSYQLCSSQTADRPKVAVVLSGGGAKGFTHIGVLKVLEEEGIPIDIIVGTSIGSIVGGLYSIGYSADDIINMAQTEDWPTLLTDNIPRKELDQYSRMERQRYMLMVPMTDEKIPGIPSGLIKGQNIINLFCGLTANIPRDANFSDFPIAFACIGTDLVTGEEVLLNSGFLPTAIFASMAIPGVFVPGEHDGHLLVDGGLVNNFPTDVAKKMGADIIIGVDISTDLRKSSELITINKVMDQIINFYILHKNSENRALCDIIIRPDVTGYNTSSFYDSAVDTLLDRGKRAATNAIPELRKLKEKYNLKPRQISTSLIKPNEWKINDVSISGKYSMSDNMVRDELKLDIPMKYSYREIKKSINNLYGTSSFKRAYFNLEDNLSGKRLNITLEEEKNWRINVGMRINTNSAVSIILNSTRKDYSKTFGLISATADISSNPKFNFLVELDRKRRSKISLMIDGSYKDLNLHLDKDRMYRGELYYASAKLYSSHKISNYSMVGSGIKEEYFYGKLNTFVTDTSLILTPGNKFITNIYGYLTYDNLDDYYFPSKGTEMYSEVSLAQDKGFLEYNPIVLFKMRNIIKVNSTLSFLLNFNGRSLLTEKAPRHLENIVGGHDYELLFNHHLPFYGLPSFCPTERNTFIGLTGIRIKIAKRHYVSFAGNCLAHNNKLLSFDRYKTIFGSGLTYAYKSAVGPIEMTMGYSDYYKKPTFSANIGFWF